MNHRSSRAERVRSFSLRLVLFLLLVAACAVAQPAQPRPTLLLISIDAFRYDYPEREHPKNIEALIATGTRADALIPQFPPITFPNHYTIVTGLTPAHHGVVDNTMFDAKLNARFRAKDHVQFTDARWWGGEPIWVTAEKQGVKAATVFWPGSEAPIEGVRPSLWLPYDKHTSSHDRAMKILEWLDLPAEKRPAMLTLYFDEVDTAGHDFGPNSPQLKQAVASVDAAIGELIDGLKKRGLYDQMNLLLVSDHGMAETSCDRVVDISSFIDRAWVLGAHNAFVSLNVPPEKLAEVYAKIAAQPHVRVYRKGEMLPRWAYAGNDRIPNLFVLADEGWSVLEFPFKYQGPCTKGAHGFDNMLPSQHGVFIAHGPAFPEGRRIPAFDNVDVYPLMTHLLGLHAAPNDGSLAPFTSILKEASSAAPSTVPVKAAN